MSISITDLPAPAASASLRLRDELLRILGDDLIALWLHGGSTFADRPMRPGDLDICGVIAHVSPEERSPRRLWTDAESRPARIVAAQEAIGREHGLAFDALYLVAGEIGSGRLPPRAFRRSHREAGWPVYRAHWLAGQYVPLHGIRPRTLLQSSATVRYALARPGSANGSCSERAVAWAAFAAHARLTVARRGCEPLSNARCLPFTRGRRVTRVEVDESRAGSAQYENASKFNARVALHARFRTNPRPWPAWVFDQLEGHDGCRVLDLGCGTGLLWQVNAPRVPASWTVALTDSSEGMLAETKRRVDGLACRVEFRAMDAQEVTFPDGAFDIVIANHMLYHVPDRARAIAEVRRVLREGGAFHATTASLDSLSELRALMREYRSVPKAARVAAPDRAPRQRPDPVIGAFSLENGAAQLRDRFASVDTRIYTDELKITEPDAIVDYFLSLNEIREGERVLADDEAGPFRDFVAQRMAREGALRATTRSGMFVCR